MCTSIDNFTNTILEKLTDKLVWFFGSIFHEKLNFSDKSKGCYEEKRFLACIIH